MDVSSPAEGSDQTKKSSGPKHKTLGNNCEFGFEHVQSGSTETRIAESDSIHTEGLGLPPKDATKNSSRVQLKENRLSAKSRKRKYMLRSSVGSVRILWSRLRGMPKAQNLSNNSLSVGAEREKERKRKKEIKKTLDDEFSRTRKRLKYLLHRMSYEQSLIDAYSGEGWKGQSLEKIKPEKELQRATSEILCCKRKIRDLFQHLDSLCAEGRPWESLFDSEGQIYSEDISCAKCGSKDFSTDNDIILCDGTCDRGFHQMCLEPPLLKEDVPPGDEGWLCPGCDCKVDCVDLLNDFRRTDLSIDDNWEKVFPEAAAAAAGDKKDDNFGYPSDDSEDNDYDPDGPEVDEKVQAEGSSSKESDFTSASDDSGPSLHHEQYLGLPSDDSEDTDFDPNVLDLDDQVKQESSSSDFTSDSEDYSAGIDGYRSSGTHEVLVSSSLDSAKLLSHSGERRPEMAGKKKESVNSELLSILEPDPSQENAAPVSGKRHKERLDYKSLHDETYGNDLSDSSDDEDWADTYAPRKKRNGFRKDAVISPKGNSQPITNGENTKDLKRDLEEAENTPKRRTCQKLDFEGTNNSDAKTCKDSPDPGSSEMKSTTPRSLGEAVTQRLYKSFRENEYPTRVTKENLANELGITFRQVSKWFSNARWSSRQSASIGASKAETPNKTTVLTRINRNVLKPETKLLPKMLLTMELRIRSWVKPSVQKLLRQNAASGMGRKGNRRMGKTENSNQQSPHAESERVTYMIRHQMGR